MEDYLNNKKPYTSVLSLLESWGITMIAMSAAAGVASYDNKTEI